MKKEVECNHKVCIKCWSKISKDAEKEWTKSIFADLDKLPFVICDNENFKFFQKYEELKKKYGVEK